EDGPFGDHLKRILISVTKFEPVERAMKETLQSGTISETDSFYRLAASGVVKKAEGGAVVPRCTLYRRYLSAHLR
ncbi:MAG TPA: AAA-like domain-containing protein, partial [Fimbriimonas sp.]|nr:AAA-like domain-containing protein [Fimbriimonas sp.]